MWLIVSALIFNVIFNINFFEIGEGLIIIWRILRRLLVISMVI